jgi:hypothetical protein
MQTVGVVLYPQHLSRTVLVAVIVGSALFANQPPGYGAQRCGNHHDVGKVGVTYLVPFVVSNVGLIVGTHRPRSAP